MAHHDCHGRRLTGTAFRCIVVFAVALAGCTQVRIKTVELQPRSVVTGLSGVKGSQGFCTSVGSIGSESYPMVQGMAMVGFDNYFKAGTQPFPCDDFRATVYRGGVTFDLSQFDKIGFATLVFDLDSYATRVGVNAEKFIPGTSMATVLGFATAPFTNDPAYEATSAVFPSNATVDIAVSADVARDWVDGIRPNYGFVLDTSLPHVDGDSHPTDNNLQVSWYKNFRLRVTYNAVLNPRAPQ